MRDLIDLIEAQSGIDPRVMAAAVAWGETSWIGDQNWLDIESLLSPYRQKQYQVLYRGHGITDEQVVALRAGKSIRVALRQSLQSWTSDIDVAKGYAESTGTPPAVAIKKSGLSTFFDYNAFGAEVVSLGIYPKEPQDDYALTDPIREREVIVHHRDRMLEILPSDVLGIYGDDKPRIRMPGPKA